MLLIIIAIASTLIITLGCCVFYLGYQLQQNRKDYQALEASLRASEQNAKKLKTELTAIQNKLVNETLLDSLTNLPSRSVFEQELQLSLEKCKRFGLLSAMLFLEINDLQTIREVVGEKMGNSLLRQIAEKVVSGVRKVDTVARFAPNTFVIFLSQLNKLESINIVIQRLFKVFSEPLRVQEEDIYFAISLGIATFPQDGDTSATLLQNAEQALMLAKKRGSNNYQFYQTEMQKKSQKEYLLYASLGRENLLSEFTLEFKPIFNIERNEIVCMDTQIRSVLSDLGQLNIEDLFRVAESCGRMTLLTESLIRAVCQQLQGWKKAGLNYSVAIPIIVRHVESPQFIYNLAEMIKAHGIDPGSIVLSILGKNVVYSEQLAKTLHMLKHIGVKLGITDLGEQGFSLEMFKHLPIDYLKLHSGFIDDLSANEKTQTILKSMALMTDLLHIQLIIQGVANHAQIELLRGFGCHWAQGDYLAAKLANTKDKMRIDEG